jgi:hypothetical protein
MSASQTVRRSNDVVKKPLHSLQAILDLPGPDRIRDPDSSRIAKRVARHHGYIGFSQQELAKLANVGDELAFITPSKLLRYIQEEIKSSIRGRPADLFH